MLTKSTTAMETGLTRRTYISPLRMMERDPKRLPSHLAADIEFYRETLNIFHVGEHFFTIANTATGLTEYCSCGTERLIGGKAREFSPEALVSRIHPADRLLYQLFQAQSLSFFRSLPLNQCLTYKARCDFRFKRDDKRHIRIMQQSVVTEVIEPGVSFKLLTVYTDISHLKNGKSMSFSVMALDDEPTALKVRSDGESIKRTDYITRRELQVLQLLARGKNSKEIAETLHISAHTVKNHRKNLLGKTGMKNSHELVLLAMERGWV